jgi:hypothetical protein
MLASQLLQLSLTVARLFQTLFIWMLFEGFGGGMFFGW